MGSSDDEETGDTGVNGHGHSPALREAEREIAEVKLRVAVLSGSGRTELDAMMGEGHARLAKLGSRSGGAEQEANAARTREALECFAASYVMARAIEYPRGELDALSAAALCYQHLGRPEVAITMLRACVDLSAKHGDGQGQAHALGNAALALRSLGQVDESISMQRKSARLALSCGDWECATRAHVNLANLFLSRASTAAREALAAAPAASALGEEQRPPQPPVLASDVPLRSHRREAESELRQALALLLALLDSQRGDERSIGKAAELEVNVCTRLAACLEMGDGAHHEEILALYRRALVSAIALSDSDDESGSLAQYGRIATSVEHKLAQLGLCEPQSALP